MGLKKSTGNMYTFVTHTYNTIIGACEHDCSYCYVKRWGIPKPVKFDENKLKTDLGKDNFIFVGSGCDMFSDSIPDNWIFKTFEHSKKFDNKYLFQSKNPENMLLFKNFAPGDSVYCTTIETNRYYPKIMGNSPKPEDRIYSGLHYVTVEPIMDFDLNDLVEMVKRISPIQTNIGADSGNNNLPEPSKDKILELIDELSKFTKVVKKKNLNRILK